MNNNTEVPDELYYLGKNIKKKIRLKIKTYLPIEIDDRFLVRSLRKYQLKEILTAHNIPYLSNITRVDLVDLFKKHIEARREEILQEYKNKQDLNQHEVYGRGRRISHRPKKYENTVPDYYGYKKSERVSFIPLYT